MTRPTLTAVLLCRNRDGFRRTPRPAPVGPYAGLEKRGHQGAL